jgi:hypothetical protein
VLSKAFSKKITQDFCYSFFIIQIKFSRSKISNKKSPNKYKTFGEFLLTFSQFPLKKKIKKHTHTKWRTLAGSGSSPA